MIKCGAYLVICNHMKIASWQLNNSLTSKPGVYGIYKSRSWVIMLEQHKSTTKVINFVVPWVLKFNSFRLQSNYCTAACNNKTMEIVAAVTSNISHL